MTNKVLLLHGWGGSDFPHWQAWLASELAKSYGEVSFLKFDNYDFPIKNTWKNQLIKQIDSFNPDIVICHSVANILWFHLCDEIKLQEIKKLFLVAPPSLSCDIQELKSFYPCKLPSNLFAKESVLVSSTNDPYITKDEVKAMAKQLNIPTKILQDAGHINADSGYGEWEWILKEVQNVN